MPATTHELADTYQSIAESLRRMPSIDLPRESAPLFDGDFAVGAAMLWAYLRNLLTTANKDTFDRSDILVLLYAIQGDPDLFVPNSVIDMADAWDAAGQEHR